ncbi:putative glutathione S-transferase 8 [Ditylenchus destructor]|nr:putative glutathione S-transferase 8 [Ditylenchus destructor]
MPSRRISTKSNNKSLGPGSMTKIQLKYLNLRAKGEPIRLLLTYVQHPFEDVRENFLEYAKYKDKHPLPRLPSLIIDDKLELTYTNVILAYLGRKFGLEPDTDEGKAMAEQLAERIQDYFSFLKPYINCLLGLVPADRLQGLSEQVFIPCCTKDYGLVVEKQLERTNTGYLVGDSLTYVDFYAACFSDFALTYGRADVFDRFPRVQYHCKAVLSLPQLQDYLKTRPDSLC